MATPASAPYKKAQRAAKASKYHATPIWVSCEILTDHMHLPTGVKRTVQGTHRIRKDQQQLRGKLAIKVAKKLTHTKGFYNIPVII